MKRIFTLLTTLFMGVAVMAADMRPKSTLVIKSADRADLKVVIDGRGFESNRNTIKVRGLDAGFHQIKVYKERFTGLFAIFGKRYEVIFNGPVTFKPHTDVTIVIDRFNRTTISNQWNNVRNNRDRRGWDDEDDFDFGRGNRFGDYDDRDDSNEYDAGMNDREFRRVLEGIQKEWLESNKLKSATQIVSYNRLTSAQVKQLLILFSFENNKLELAKRAYANTTDKRNYAMVYDVFSFHSSKDELARYIRNFR